MYGAYCETVDFDTGVKIDFVRVWGFTGSGVRYFKILKQRPCAYEVYRPCQPLRCP